jgi:hypothetical protein
MRHAFDLIASLHQRVGNLEWIASRKLSALDQAFGRNDPSPHPDDTAELRSMLMSDALALRKLAAEIDARRTELERDAVQYLAAAE